jgi:RNA polymerase sigma factor (sigma-70 family)
MRRRTSEHRLVLGIELDRLDASRALWRDDDPPSHESAVLGHALRAAVADALTDKQREVVEAYFFEGASQGEIARRLGVSQQVVQKRIFGTMRGDKMVGGALARLREALAPHVVRVAGAKGEP